VGFQISKACHMTPTTPLLHPKMSRFARITNQKCAKTQYGHLA